MRAKLSSRSRRFALGGLVVMLLPVGVAHLAENAVPVTYAGVAEQSITIQKSLTIQDGKVNVAHDGTFQFQTLKVVLTVNGDRVGGVLIDFYIGGKLICSGTTSPGAGMANCNSDQKYSSSDFAGLGADPLTYPYVAVVSSGPLTGLSSPPAHLKQITGTGGGSEVTGNSADNSGSNGDIGANTGNGGADNGNSGKS